MLSNASRWRISGQFIKRTLPRLPIQTSSTPTAVAFAGRAPVSHWCIQAMGKSTSAKHNHASPAAASSSSSSAFEKRPCVTCGRQMTPNATQVAAGNDPQRCSRTCKFFKLGKPSNQAVVSDHVSSAVVERVNEHDDDAVYLQSAMTQFKFLAQRQAKDKSHIVVDVDAWIELTLLDVATRVNRDSAAKALPTCEDVEEALRVLVRFEAESQPAAAAPTNDDDGDNDKASPTANKRSLGSVLESRGLRERVRQAARRLFILPRNNWACADLLDETQSHLAPSIDVLQDGRVVDGLHGVSYAKGTMQIRARKV